MVLQKGVASPQALLSPRFLPRSKCSVGRESRQAGVASSPVQCPGHRTVVRGREAKESLCLCKVRCKQDTSGHLTGATGVMARERGLGFPPCLSPEGLCDHGRHCPSLGLGVLVDKGQRP